MSKKQYRPPELNRDHARPRTAPAPSSEAVESWLAELISPATYNLSEHYSGLGLRWRVLTLPVMLALVLGVIWRQVPSISDASRLLSRESVLWAPPARVSQQALSQRLRCLLWELFAELLGAVLPRLLVADATTLEAVFKRVGVLREASGTVLGDKLMGLLDLPSKLPVELWLDEDADAIEKSFLDRLKAVLPEGALFLIDRASTPSSSSTGSQSTADSS